MHDANSEQELLEQGGLAASLRSNPIPLFLIGAGIGWILLSQARHTERYEHAANWAERRTRTMRRRARHAYEDVRDRAGEAYEGAKDVLHSAAAEVGLGSDGAAHRGAALGPDEGRPLIRRTRDAMGHFGDSLRGIVDEHPIATGLMGIALGMAIGASLPRTVTEDKAMGGYRDDLLDRARDAMQEARSKATEAVDAGVDAVEQQVRSPTAG